MNSQPLRVLHVLGFFDHGGTESLVINLLRKIDRKKIMFDFVVHSEAEGVYEKEVKELGAHIYRVPKYKGYNHLSYVKAWETIFSDHPEYKIVHGHVRSTASIYLKIAKEYGLTTIAHSHSVSSGSGIAGRARQFFQRNIVTHSDYKLACSIYAGEWLFGENTVLNPDFYVMKNAINAETYLFNSKTRQTYRKDLGLTDKKVIGHIGRFHESKNHKRLVELFSSIKKVVPEAVLLLIGEGQLLPEIKQQVVKEGLSDSVMFLGSRDDAAQLYQAMDLFLFPSLYEGLGIAVVEAQASGLPSIVASSIPEEAIFTPFVNVFSLKEDNSIWISAAFSELGADKRWPVDLEDIKEAGYDIDATAKWYESFVINLAE